MTLDLIGKKIIVINEKHSIGRAIAEAVAREGADIVIWLRNGDDELKEAKLLSTTQLKVAPQQSNGAAPISLWRQAMAQKSYW
jgi:NAD(P)-dependent dehydrogenase (short-subunit alcohol dehydrogenase family)